MIKKITLLLLFTCISNTFSQNFNFINKADKLIARGGSSSALVTGSGGGAIYISNGFSATTPITSDIEKYNSATNTWSLFSTTTPSIAKRYGNSQIVPGNFLYLFNGITDMNILNDKIEKINLTTGSLTVSTTLNPNPVYSAGSAYFSSNLLSFGGCSDAFNAVYSNKFYSISLNPETYTALADMPVGLETKGKMLFGSGENLYTFGGYKEINNVAQNFETLTINTNVALTDWINLAETGTKVYKGKLFTANKYAEISAFESVVANQETSNKAWLISNPLTASSLDQVFLNFDTKDGFNNGATLQPYLITNWTGDITTSTKTLLFGNIASGSTTGFAANFTNSGNILLSGNLSNFRIGFKYTGGYSPIKTTTFQIDNVRVFKTIISNNIYKYSFNSGVNSTWTTLNTTLPQSISAYAIAGDNTKAYITGDYNNQTFTGVFDSKTETFTVLTQSNMIGRRHHNSEIWNNILYITGGNTDTFAGSVLSSTQSVDLSTLSSLEFATNSEFKVYPNPATEFVNLNEEIINVSIYAIDGKKIDIQKVNNTLNISQLTNGIYLLTAENKEGKTFKTKLLKQ